MQQLIKITQLLIFTLLIMVIGVFVWQFINPFVQVFFLPLIFLNIYYLLLYYYLKLSGEKASKIWFYIGVFFIAIPLVAYGLNYKKIIELSFNILTSFVY